MSDEDTRRARLRAKAQNLAERDLRAAHHEEYARYYARHLAEKGLAAQHRPPPKYEEHPDPYDLPGTERL